MTSTEMQCVACASERPREWICLGCNVRLHDNCIAKHKEADQNRSHSIIPAFDALTQGAIIKGEPTKPRVDKIVISGPGVQPEGILGIFDSSFTVDTYGAGPGRIAVQIKGPKDSFNVKMTPQEDKPTTIICSYEATEPGEYVIKVTWSDIDVPGSPFGIQLRNKSK